MTAITSTVYSSTDKLKQYIFLCNALKDMKNYLCYIYYRHSNILVSLSGVLKITHSERAQQVDPTKMFIFVVQIISSLSQQVQIDGRHATTDAYEASSS